MKQLGWQYEKEVGPILNCLLCNKEVYGEEDDSKGIIYKCSKCGGQMFQSSTHFTISIIAFDYYYGLNSFDGYLITYNIYTKYSTLNIPEEVNLRGKSFYEVYDFIKSEIERKRELSHFI